MVKFHGWSHEVELGNAGVRGEQQVTSPLYIVIHLLPFSLQPLKPDPSQLERDQSGEYV